MAPRTDTHADLLTATRDALASGPLASVTAREVAGRAGANLASIGYHFGSKDALVAEALVAEVTDLMAPVLELLASDEEPAGRALAAAALLEQLFARSRPRIAAYLSALATAPHDEAVRARLAGLFGQVQGALAAEITRLAASGALAPWVDPEAMAAVIVAVVQGVVVAAAVEPDAPASRDHRAVSAQFLLLLLAARVPS